MLKTKIRRPHREREALQAPQGIWRPFSPSPREEGLGSVVDRRRRRRRLGSTGADKHAASRRRRVGAKAMAWWDKAVAFPVKRACVAVAAAAAARVKAPNPSGGIQKLHDDVQMCGYQDVQVMWEMVRRSEMELSNKRKRCKRLLWRLPTWSNRTSSTDLMDPH
ncbi:unnamed protein product [Musa acuminata var. zebrina]